MPDLLPTGAAANNNDDDDDDDEDSVEVSDVGIYCVLLNAYLKGLFCRFSHMLSKFPFSLKIPTENITTHVESIPWKTHISSRLDIL